LKRVVITGAMGSGKSTLLAELRKRGFTVVPEPARIVLAEQRAAGGDGVPERGPQRFCDLMLERMKSDYDEHPHAFYDRGIPDLVGYARLFGLEPPRVDDHRYDGRVFVLPGWLRDRGSPEGHPGRGGALHHRRMNESFNGCVLATTSTPR
jgi:predicted ATPase